MLLQKAVFTRILNGRCGMYCGYTPRTEFGKLSSRHLHVSLRFEEIERHTVFRENKPLFSRFGEQMPESVRTPDLNKCDSRHAVEPRLAGMDCPSRCEMLSDPVDVVQTVSYVRMIGENVTNGHASSVLSLPVVVFLEFVEGRDIEMSLVLDDEITFSCDFIIHVDLDLRSFDRRDRE
nr:MAG TPA: hypothetical protein [Caudoviricetes sp.]